MEDVRAVRFANAHLSDMARAKMGHPAGEGWDTRHFKGNPSFPIRLERMGHPAVVGSCARFVWVRKLELGSLPMVLGVPILLGYAWIDLFWVAGAKCGCWGCGAGWGFLC